jgi:Zn-dependent protease
VGPEQLVDALVWYVVFVFSVTLHEAAHAYTALRLGDPTAYAGGQVSIDPIPHMRREPVGMIVLPILTLATTGWPIGWASAPLDFFWAQRHPKRAAWVALAGPAGNLLLVLACAGLVWLGIAAGVFATPHRVFRASIVLAPEGGIWASAAFLLSAAFFMNLALFTFNLLPVPPLDGSSAVALLLPDEQAGALRNAMASPAFALIGMLVAWKLFPALFDPVFRLALGLLYPGSGWS